MQVSCLAVALYELLLICFVNKVDSTEKRVFAFIFVTVITLY